jgi:hypothetical protein
MSPRLLILFLILLALAAPVAKSAMKWLRPDMTPEQNNRANQNFDEHTD